MKKFKVLTYVWVYDNKKNNVYILQVSDTTNVVYLMLLSKQEINLTKSFVSSAYGSFANTHNMKIDFLIPIYDAEEKINHIFDINPLTAITTRVHSNIQEFKQWLAEFNKLNTEINLVL